MEELKDHGSPRRRSSAAAAMEQRFGSLFARVGSQIYRHPIRFLLGPVLVCLLLTIGFARFEIENRGEELYTPQDSESFGHRDLVDEIFGYEAQRMTVYSTSSSDTDSNVLTKPLLLRFMEMYIDMAAVNVTVDGKSKTLATSCVQGSNGACDQVSILDLWDYNATRLLADPDVLATVNAGGEDGLGRELVMADILGGLTRDSNTNDIVSAAALRYAVEMENDAVATGNDHPEDEALTEWELQVSDTVRQRNAYAPLLMFPESPAIQQHESDKALSTDITLLGLGVCFLLTYTYIVFSRRNWVHTHGALTLAAVASIALATVASFGFVLALGVKFNMVVATLAFLLLALGVDDAYVIMAAYDREDIRQLPQRERIAQSLKVAAASISVTSLTDMAAFLAGAFTPIPAIRAFCFFAAVGVLGDFLMQTTFFVAALVISGHREDAARADLFCCIKPSDPERLACTCSKARLPFSGHEEDSSLRRFMGGTYARILLHPVGKICALSFTALLFILSIVAATELKMEIQVEWFVPDNSFLQDAFDVRDTYFPQGDSVPFGVYTQDVDYPNLQVELDSLEADLNSSAVIRRCDNWHTEFKRWTAETHANLSAAGSQHVPAGDYYRLLEEFVQTDDGAQFVEDIVFAVDKTTNATRVRGTKIPCHFTSADSASKWISDMKAARAIADRASALETYAYAFIFLFLDGLDVVLETTMINLALAAVAVCAISIITLMSLAGGAFVFAMLVSTDVMLLGSFYLTGLDINMITAVNLVISLGLAVDGNLHLMHAFLHAQGSRHQRAVSALHSLGASTVHGGVSSALVLLALVGAQSYVFQVFFKSLFFAILIGYAHAIVVLPVLLALFGPKSVEGEYPASNHTGTLIAADGVELEPKGPAAGPGQEVGSDVAAIGSKSGSFKPRLIEQAPGQRAHGHGLDCVAPAGMGGAVGAVDDSTPVVAISHRLADL